MIQKISSEEIIDDLGISFDELLNFTSKEIREKWENEKDDQLKAIYKRLLVMYAVRNYREKRFLEKNLIDEKFTLKYGCRKNCDKTYKLQDEFGWFWYSCKFSEMPFCKISEENKRKEIMEQKKKKAFYPFNIPPDFDKVTLKGCVGMVQRKVQNYLEKMVQEKGLTVYGGTGTGKTSIFYLVVKKLIDLEKDVLFLTINQIFTAYMKHQDDLIKRILNADYLMVDDLGREYNAEYGMAMFDTCICDRYANQKITSFNMNITKEQFLEKYPRVFDRQIPSNVKIIITGESLRKE